MLRSLPSSSFSKAMNDLSARISGTVYEAFRRTVREHAEKDFLCVLPRTAASYGIAARTVSYRNAASEVDFLFGRYREAGYGHGHRVGLMVENRPAFFFHWLALNALGVSVVPFNTEWRSAELEYLVGHSEICGAVVPESRRLDFVHAARAAGRPLGVTQTDLSDLPQVAFSPPAQTLPDADTECALLYTSGTTGRPKGCVLPNEYFLWAGCWYANLDGLCEIRPGRERLLTPLPLSHMNAMAFSSMVMLLTGGCIVQLDRFHPSTWWESVRDSGATIAHYLGVMPPMLLGAKVSPRDGDHAVRFGFGAGVSPRLHAAFERRFGFPLVEAWAMTETGAGAAIIANREPRKVGSACFGRAGPEIEYRLVDDSERDVAAGQPGELLVRHAGDAPRFGFFREYLKDAAATEAAWAGGYFHTGDVVQVDADGDLQFVDRKKNIIRRSGENISAVEVESVLLQHPGVAAVGVTAVPDEVRGDEVMACVVPRRHLYDAEQVAFGRELTQFCLERLAYFKAPGYVGFCEGLPLTATEKIQRARLKDLGQALLGGSACVDLRALKKRTVAVT
jgi:acyl-CoA synthetase (AMP-forming)/AMP-acid ligase II